MIAPGEAKGRISLNIRALEKGGELEKKRHGQRGPLNGPPEAGMKTMARTLQTKEGRGTKIPVRITPLRSSQGLGRERVSSGGLLSSP